MLIHNIKAREIFDSRGMPTLEVEVHIENGIFGRASVPSGISKGTREALELRDNDLKRFNGKGLLNNINIINNIISPNLIGINVLDQLKIDQMLISLDGTVNKSRLGANTLLAVSLAVAKAGAASNNLPLFAYISNNNHYYLPIPLINIINGGAHADNLLDIQEFMIAPVNTETFSDAMQMASEIFYSLKSLLIDKGYNTNYGDEGGFAPNFFDSKETLEYIMRACTNAGYEPGNDILFAIDAAASEFYHNGKYRLQNFKDPLTSSELINYYNDLVNLFPIFSIEDPLAESDLEGWRSITKKLGSKTQIVGDDLFVTNPHLFQQGIEQNLGNAILIKPNQIGTLSEAIETINMAKKNNYNTIISHRSGETEDVTISHLAVATNAKQIKAGSMTRSERLAKYNELIRINELIHHTSVYAGYRFRQEII